jgi:UDP-2,3-diacylglucosamine hydrolase
VPVYFASDMHLRIDRPERARRLARWVDGLAPDDALYLVGDVCDFWQASRQTDADRSACEGLRALARFRSRGGALTVLTGNHDRWLGPYYESVLGARLVPEPQTVEAHGLRVFLNHGHRAGGRQPWKAGMESRAFLTAFGLLPEAVARGLERTLDSTNDRSRAEDEARLYGHFRDYLARVRPRADLAVFGHVHTPLDDPGTTPRMIVLGGWHGGASYLRVDGRGARLVVEPDTLH